MSYNCAVVQGGTWWHNECTYAQLNGQWGEGLSTRGIAWYQWKSWTNVKSSMMMVRCTK